MFLPTRLALVTTCVLFAACDSAEPEAPAETPAFVGSWMRQSFEGVTYATLDRSQTALDPFSPAQGEVRIDGAFSSTLRYLTSRYVSRDDGTTDVSYTLVSAMSPVSGTPFAVLDVSPRFASLGFYASGGGVSTAYFPRFPLTTPPVSQSGDTLRVGLEAYVASPGTGAPVTVRGTLVLARRRIEAGVETRMSSSTSVSSNDGATLTIRADGTVSRSSRNSALASGTWSAGPDSTVTLRTEGFTTSTSRYRVTGSTLRLESTESFDCDAACRVQIEDASDLSPGSVQSTRLVYVFTYTRT